MILEFICAVFICMLILSLYKFLSEELVQPSTEHVQLPNPNFSANVVVLTQPQELVSITSPFTGPQTSTEEIVYDTVLVNSQLGKEAPVTNICDAGNL